MQGIILKGANNVFDVEGEDSVYSCVIKGKVLKGVDDFHNPLAPGDEVLFEVHEEGEGRITERLIRRSALVRFNVKTNKPQVLAANMDNVIYVTTPCEPPFRASFIDRALMQAERDSLNPLIFLNKCDIKGIGEDVERRLEIWEGLGYRVLRGSVRTGEGIRELVDVLKNKLNVFVGASGVGKSSLINVLDERCVLKTGSLSRKYGRGNHTTTKGELLHLEVNSALTGGVQRVITSVIDTPGIRHFINHGIEHTEVAFYFREFQSLLGKCTFAMKCTHTVESGCAILDALERDEVSRERYESFIRIREQIKNKSFGD